MTHQTLLDLFAGSLHAIEEVVADVPDERAADQPAGVRNHPAWTLAHLCVAFDFTLHLLDRQAVCPGEWQKVAGTGSQPQTDRAAYPPLSELLETLRRQHELITEAVRTAPEGHFDKPAPDFIRHFAPTIGHVVAYMLASHEQNHLGQLQAWKRAAGLMKA